MLASVLLYSNELLQLCVNLLTWGASGVPFPREHVERPPLLLRLTCRGAPAAMALSLASVSGPMSLTDAAHLSRAATRASARSGSTAVAPGGGSGAGIAHVGTTQRRDGRGGSPDEPEPGRLRRCRELLRRSFKVAAPDALSCRNRLRRFVVTGCDVYLANKVLAIALKAGMNRIHDHAK